MLGKEVAICFTVFALMVSNSPAGSVQLPESESGPKTVLDGVYTEAQAFRGESAYRLNCSLCHDNPAFSALQGGLFMDTWREDELDTLLRSMQTMPPSTPGTLDPDAYVDILAYALWLNGFPYGADELEADETARILLIGHDGPQPLPNLSMIQSVGCLTQGPGAVWTLTTSTNPERIRNALDPSTSDEIQRARSAEPGMQEFELRNIAGLGPGFDADTLTGHRVLVKGVLNRRSAGEAINTMRLESVSTTCSP